MKMDLIDISPSGAVMLGDKISCDGFHRDYKIRVQTHIHDDHMDNFETSKGYQDIYFSEHTKKLLMSEFNADLPYRDNLYSVDLNVPRKINNCRVTLISNEHMLGSVQVSVEYDNGTTFGYSGDFHWPIEKVIKVNALVVDSTHGTPIKQRQYTEEEAETALIKLVHKYIKHASIYIYAKHRGTIQRALQIISSSGMKYPIIGSPKLCSEVEVYRQCGYGIGGLTSFKSAEGKEIMDSTPYIRVFGSGDRMPIDIEKGISITLSPIISNPKSPIIEYSEKAYGVSMSNHADFEGIISYVKETGAEYVVTDQRGGHAVELAQEIKARLGIEAIPANKGLSYEWGV